MRQQVHERVRGRVEHSHAVDVVLQHGSRCLQHRILRGHKDQVRNTRLLDAMSTSLPPSLAP